jgi:hypothetical protein
LLIVFPFSQAGDDPVEKGLANDPDATLYSKLLASLKLRADEDKTIGTLFVPTDRVSMKSNSVSISVTKR